MNQMDLEDAQMQGQNKAKQWLADIQAKWNAPLIGVLPKMIMDSAPPEVQAQLKQLMQQQPPTQQGGTNNVV